MRDIRSVHAAGLAAIAMAAALTACVTEPGGPAVATAAGDSPTPVDAPGDAAAAGILQGLGAPPAAAAAPPALNQLSLITARERGSGQMLTITNQTAGIAWHFQGGSRNENLLLLAALDGRRPLWGTDYWLNSTGDFRSPSTGTNQTLISLVNGVVLCCDGAMSLTFDIVSTQ